jgi:hypothetical protein
VNSGFVSLEDRPNSWSLQVRVTKCREKDPSHWILTTGEPLDRTPHGIMFWGFKGWETLHLDRESHKVSSVEGSCGQVAHPVSGDHVVDRWHKHTTEKGRSG